MNSLKSRIFDLSCAPQLMSVATVTDDGQPRVRYVIGMADDELNFRFGTHLLSDKIAQLRRNRSISITLGDTRDQTMQWLQFQGFAEIMTCREERETFWMDGLSAHFNSADDPNYCVVISRPSKIVLVSKDGKVNRPVFSRRSVAG